MPEFIPLLCVHETFLPSVLFSHSFKIKYQFGGDDVAIGPIC